jgi:ATP-dependent exoDNAse (exonuclease V) beta subunit
MNVPADQDQRDQFVHNLEQNFSVIASAGSGKTRAITDRIVAIAQSPQALEWLPSLVVVTFTNRAADEMQQRARQRIFEKAVSLDVLTAFNRVFFGTIHSFCVKLLRQHGHQLAMPAQLDVITDDDTLWMEFVQQHTTVGATLTITQRQCLQRLAPVRQLMELGRHATAALIAKTPGDFPICDFSAMHDLTAKGNGKANIEISQERLRVWEQAWAGGDGFLPLPERAGTARNLVAAWNSALDPIRHWLRVASLHVAAEIASAYRAFRLGRGLLTYGDQIALASELIRNPETARRIREKDYRVILDEAQDTDPAQFDVLLELTRPPAASGTWLTIRADPPRPGHFCMVGDFQQSIFGGRADLAHYRRVHDALLETGAGEAVKFSVTFRLDQAQLDLVNATFPRILHGANQQVNFVTLNARPGVLSGQVVRFDPGDLPDVSGMNEGERARQVAARMARWLRAQGLERLRAHSWRDVAILCPRKGWFPPLRSALRREGFEVQIQSERDLKGDSPAYAWFTALTAVLAAPHDSYELVGVLREVFGLSDHDLAVFADGRSERFQIAELPAWPGVVGDALRLLAGARAKITTLPLFSALREVVQATQLRDRLLVLPSDQYEDLDDELENLLTLAAAAEAEGKTLAEFASVLRAGFSAIREARPSARDAVQLITAHKAKGSEWQTVVIPFFARQVRGRSGSGPRLLRDPRNGQVHVTLTSEDIDETLKTALDLAQRQEMERLLYVALTRAKHTLVLAHDHDFFATKTGVPNHAQARHFRAANNEPNAATFTALPTTASLCPATAAEQIACIDDRTREQAVEPLAICAGSVADDARARAAVFVKRNPSALAEAFFEDSSAARSRPKDVPNTGALYGTWWHEFVELLDWSAGVDSWNSTFADAVAASPDPDRSRREWLNLCGALTSDTEIAQWLVRGERRVRPEVPFLWAMSERECLEGVIDLVVWSSTRGAWLILDWKTNRDTADLSAHYEPQLAAYWKAVSEMLNAPVVTALYATASGAWLPYAEERLAETWRKICHQPEVLAAAVVRDH